jgi:hypothetical protein
MKALIIFLLAVISYSKILVVNSYDNKDQCGMPQLNGFLSEMYEHGYDPTDFDIYFLNSRIIPKSKLLIKSKQILKKLKNYDYVVTFDDTAFQLIAIPASKKNKFVFFSGINIPFNTYQKKYHLNKDLFGGVFEKLHAKEVLNTFNKIKPIRNIALFYSKGVGKIVKNQIKNELKNTVYENKIRYIYCETVQCLEKETKKVNENKDFTLFIPLTLSLKQKNSKIPIYKLKNIYLKNLNKPDVSFNMNFAKLGFLGFGGVDFFNMGKNCAYLMLKYMKNKKLNIINAPKAYYFINASRAKKIDFQVPKWYIENYVKEVIW